MHKNQLVSVHSDILDIVCAAICEDMAVTPISPAFHGTGPTDVTTENY